MKVVKRVLVVSAKGEMRLRSPRGSLKLELDEIAFPIEVQIPDGWSKFYRDQVLTLTMPDPPEGSVRRTDA